MFKSSRHNWNVCALSCAELFALFTSHYTAICLFQYDALTCLPGCLCQWSQGIRQLLWSNSAYPTSTRQRPSGGAGGAVARLQVASISFSNASLSAPATASLIAVATRTRTIYQINQAIIWSSNPRTHKHWIISWSTHFHNHYQLWDILMKSVHEHL